MVSHYSLFKTLQESPVTSPLLTVALWKLQKLSWRGGQGGRSGIWSLLSLQSHPLRSLPPPLCSSYPGFSCWSTDTPSFFTPQGLCPCRSFCLESLSPRTSHGFLQIAESPFLTSCSKTIFPFPLVILLLCLIFLQSTCSCLTLLHVCICCSVVLLWNVSAMDARTLFGCFIHIYWMNMCNI